MSEFKVIETQEQFNEAIGERVLKAKDAVRKEYEGFLAPSEVEERTSKLNETITSLQKDLEESKSTIEALKTEKAQYETSSVKTRVAHELGLGFESIEFIAGHSEEEIRQSAETLKKLIGSNKPSPEFKAELQAGRNEDADYLKMLREMKG